MIKHIHIILTLLFIVGLSCEKKRVGPQKCDDSDFLGFEVSEFVLIGSEGFFESSNSSLSLYDPVEMEPFNAVFYEEYGISPGDVLQSMYAMENSIFLVVNHSSLILELDNESLGFVNEIVMDNRSPRFMVSAGDESFISNFALNPGDNPVYIDVMDNSSRSIVDSIDVGMWVEEMVIKDSLLFACGMGENKVIVIDVNGHEIIDEIEVGVEPISIVVDVNGSIWVMCTGGFEEEIASLWKMDYANNDIVSFPFENISDYPTHLKLNGAKDQLFYLNNGVYRMAIGAPQIPEVALINETHIYYGLGVDPLSNDIYYAVSDSLGPGGVYRYNIVNGLIDEFQVGIYPSSFLFVQ